MNSIFKKCSFVHEVPSLTKFFCPSLMGTFCAHNCPSVHHHTAKSLSLPQQSTAALTTTARGGSLWRACQRLRDSRLQMKPFLLALALFSWFLSQTPPSDCGPPPHLPTSTTTTTPHHLLSLCLSASHRATATQEVFVSR